MAIGAYWKPKDIFVQPLNKRATHVIWQELDEITTFNTVE